MQETGSVKGYQTPAANNIDTSHAMPLAGI
jgi:hypothetical protein